MLTSLGNVANHVMAKKGVLISTWVNITNFISHLKIISERLSDLFKDDTDFVPVVRGAPNVKAMSPANALILVIDYNSQAELAHYLEELGANETTYLSYIKGKDKYINKSNLYVLGMCSLSDKHNNKLKRRTWLDILQLMSNEQCVLPK